MENKDAQEIGQVTEELHDGHPVIEVYGVKIDATTCIPVTTKPWPTAEQLRELRAKEPDPKEAMEKARLGRGWGWTRFIPIRAN